MQQLCELSARVVVMAERSRKFLLDIYGVPAEKIDLIPHGIPDMPFVDPNFFQGPVRRGGQVRRAHVRAALAEQRH